METHDIVGVDAKDLNDLMTIELRKSGRIGENDSLDVRGGRIDVIKDVRLIEFEVIKGKSSVSEACASVGLSAKDVKDLNDRVG